MNEKEIIELIAGLNPEALEAFRTYMQYNYTKLFMEAAVLLGIFLGGGWLLFKGMMKLIKEGM